VSETTDCYDCTGAMAELDAFVRGELGAESLERMRQHLARCSHCDTAAQYEAAFRARLRALAGPCCPEALRARINTLLADGTDAPA
jgi:anti-sigma factor (TIGR02949 family)